MTMAPKVSGLQKMSDDEIVRTYDSLAEHTGVRTGFYLDELVRRETARSAERLVELTQQLRWLTIAIAGATIIALAISVVALLRS